MGKPRPEDKFSFGLGGIILPNKYSWYDSSVEAYFQNDLNCLEFPSHFERATLQQFTAWFPYLFAASDYILLTDVRRELQIVKPPQRADEPIENAPLSRRVAWGINLFASGTRGLGWAHEPRHANTARPSPSTPRGTFAWSQIFQAVGFAVLFETAHFFNMRNPALTWNVPMAAAAMCNHALSAAFSDSTSASGPEDWPLFMGSITLAWSVRDFWGRVWHQSMRRFLSTHCEFVAHQLIGLKPGSTVSVYTQLYVAFLIPGLMHYLPEYMARSSSSSCRQWLSPSKSACRVWGGVLGSR
ncbi:membrane bound O-acyl transferase family-domain-containing protein [Mycena galopus ATCC 62051]|nr:membrane bound O-acyl transferase family-domain-containing protein [Mycena galopus ATCC 62051]